MRVLHVVESAGAGVMTSLAAMIEATPEVEHRLAVWPRRQHVDDDLARSGRVPTTRLPGGLRSGGAALRALVASTGPDVVHAHSSYAGLLVRRRGGPGAPVVYSPHCFAFERRDLPAPARAAVRRIEGRLARRTAMVAAVAPHEADLARALGAPGVCVVPNRAPGPLRLAQEPRPGRPFEVVTVGRISAQKDWELLLEVRRIVGDDPALRWTWIGDGDPAAVAALRSGGVHVTRWLPQPAVRSRLAGAQAYLHTAAWEAAPMSLLEAGGSGVPLVVRALPALAGTPGLVDAGAEGLAAALQALREPRRWYDAQRASLDFAAAHSRDAQRNALLAAWTHAARIPARTEREQRAG